MTSYQHRMLVLSMFIIGSILVISSAFFLFFQPSTTVAFDEAVPSQQIHLGDTIQQFPLKNPIMQGGKLLYQEDQSGYAHYSIQMYNGHITEIARNLWKSEQTAETLSLDDCTAFIPLDATEKMETQQQGVTWLYRYHSDTLEKTFQNVHFGSAPAGDFDLVISFRKIGNTDQKIGCMVVMGEYQSS